MQGDGNKVRLKLSIKKNYDDVPIGFYL